MAIFSSATVQTTTVTNSATKIFTPKSALYADGAYATDVTIINTGSTACHVGIAAVTTTGLLLNPGNQVTIEGYKYAAGASDGDTAGDIYAITSSGTTTVEAGLATVTAVD